MLICPHLPLRFARATVAGDCDYQREFVKIRATSGEKSRSKRRFQLKYTERLSHRGRSLINFVTHRGDHERLRHYSLLTVRLENGTFLFFNLIYVFICLRHDVNDGMCSFFIPPLVGYRTNYTKKTGQWGVRVDLHETKIRDAARVQRLLALRLNPPRHRLHGHTSKQAKRALITRPRLALFSSTDSP